MTENEKKLKQAKYRIEETQARDRVRERKLRTRRLIQEGAILEKVLPEVVDAELDFGSLRNEPANTKGQCPAAGIESIGCKPR